MKFHTCGICLASHLADSHCNYCGAFAIEGTYYNFHTGREMARALPRPVNHLVDSVVRHCQSIPEQAAA